MKPTTVHLGLKLPVAGQLNPPTVRELKLYFDNRGLALRECAAWIFRYRRQHGVPVKHVTPATLRETRDALRKAIGHVRKSRDALLVDQGTLYELELACARIVIGEVLLNFSEPIRVEWVQDTNRRTTNAPKGGQAKAANQAAARAQAKYKPEAELLKTIRDRLDRGDRMLVTRWTTEYGLQKSAIYERINKIKADIAAS